MHILRTNNIRLQYIHILVTQNITSKSILYAYSMYSKH